MVFVYVYVVGHVFMDVGFMCLFGLSLSDVYVPLCTLFAEL